MSSTALRVEHYVLKSYVNTSGAACPLLVHEVLTWVVHRAWLLDASLPRRLYYWGVTQPLRDTPSASVHSGTPGYDTPALVPLQK
jgi:hypothetical protein